MAPSRSPLLPVPPPATDDGDAAGMLQALADAVDDGMFVADLRRTRFRFVSPRVLSIWGLAAEDLARAPACFEERVLPADRWIYRQREDAERRGEPVDVTFRIRHDRLGLRWLRARTRARPLQGELCVYGLITDVTGERERELELQRARDEAEAASRARSDFVAAVSHEMRTPMNGILGMTELLLGTGLDTRQRRFAQAVLRSGESLLEIVNGVLDFSQAQAGRLEIAATDFDLPALVDDTLALLAPRARDKRIGLRLALPAAPLPARWVHGDGLRLRQLLANLLDNAVKFTHAGEVVVSLQPAPDERLARPAGGWLLRLTVSDTGIGIEPAALPRIFDAFSQGQRGSARRYGGLGLGLAISQELAQLMGGTLSVSSTPGEGSRFELLLPLGPAGTTGVAEEDAGALPHRRLLVVGGEPAERAELDRLLRAWGQHAVLAATAAQALALLQVAADAGGGFDVALLADPLPDGSAAELARRLRSVPIAHLPVLLMWTPPGARPTAPAPLPPGFVAAVERPLRRENLRRALRSCAAAAPAAAAGPAHARAPAQAKPPHVLVVEDNVVNQEVAAQMLRGLGCRVRVACSAADGLKALCEARFDLVLMDIHMPGMDGAAALQRFRAGPSGRLPFVTPAATPVIAVTANAPEGGAEAFLALGFDDYLSKPFRQSQLHTMLKRRLTPAAPATGADAGGAPADAPAAATGDRWAVLLQVLDAPSLDRLRELDPKGTNGLIVRVLKAFEGSLQRLLAQLQDARRQGDHAAIRHVAHTLKSSSASVGALELSRLCADIERRIRQDDTQDLDPLLDGMIGESGRVLAVLTPALGG